MVTWVTKEEAFPVGTEFHDHRYADIALNMATDLLYHLTGQRFQGVSEITEMYGTTFGQGSVSTEPHLIRGKFYNLPTGSSRNTPNRRLRLRQQPVRSVEEVVVNNRIMDPSEYQLRNNSFLVRTNRLGWIFDGLNEIEISYTYGAEPPVMGKEAVIRLAEEFIFSFDNDNRCALPERVTAVTRQNVSMTIMDPQEFLKDGRTGVYMVDLFIKTYNPTGSLKKNQLIVPGQPHAERIN